MKKSVLFIVLLSLQTTLIYSQNNGFTGGAFFNANGIHFAGDNEIFWQSPNGKVWGGGGLSGGILVKREISKTIYFGLELRYIQKGSVFEYANEYGSRSVETTRINYAEIPVLIGYTFNINKTKFCLETGLAYGKQISSELHINKLTSLNESENRHDFKDDDLSWIGSLKIPISKSEKLLLGIRASYSLKSIHKNYNLRNLVYGIQLDYLLH